MQKIIIPLLVLVFILTVSCAEAFEFAFPRNGEVVSAGTTIKATVSLGDLPIPFGVLFSAPWGVLVSKLDSTAPFKWEVKIPKDYYGPLTLWAVVRRYAPIAYSPSTSVTIFVVRPALRLSSP